MSVCLSVHTSIYPSFNLCSSVLLFVQLSVHLSTCSCNISEKVRRSGFRSKCHQNSSAFLYECMTVCLSVNQSTHPSIVVHLSLVGPSDCLSVCPTVYMFLQYFWKNEEIRFQVTMSPQFICLSVCSYIHLPILQSLVIGPSVCLSVCPAVCPSVYMFLQYFR
jgi:hypothetical protein